MAGSHRRLAWHCVGGPRTNQTIREEDVQKRFGVRRCQLRDYFSLIGDSSDNIPGARSGSQNCHRPLEPFWNDLRHIRKPRADRGTLLPRFQDTRKQARKRAFGSGTGSTADRTSLRRSSRPVLRRFPECHPLEGPLPDAAERFSRYGFDGGLRSIESFAYRKFSG